MFAFDLKKTQVWVTMALLLLCFSICPNRCYPHVEEDEDLTGAVDNEEDYQPAQDNDEEEEDLMEDSSVENEPTKAPDCIPNWTKCDKAGTKCCNGPAFTCESPSKNNVYWCVDEAARKQR